MTKRDALFTKLEKAYDEARKTETEELHNAIGAVIEEHKASIQNVLFVLEIIRFELLEAKCKEMWGVVKLSDKLPMKTMGEQNGNKK